jgi:hypothetical protein
MRRRTKKEYKLTEIGADIYPSLEAAQAALLEPLAEVLAIAIRKGLAAVALVVSDGRVVLPEREQPRPPPQLSLGR